MYVCSVIVHMEIGITNQIYIYDEVRRDINVPPPRPPILKQRNNFNKKTLKTIFEIRIGPIGICQYQKSKYRHASLSVLADTKNFGMYRSFTRVLFRERYMKQVSNLLYR